MVYLLIIVLQLIGIGLHVMQKITAMDDANPDKARNEIISLFFRKDWDSLAVSMLVLAFNLVAHYIIVVYAPTIAAIQYFELYSFALAFVLGYAGQRLIYKYLGKAEKILDEKSEKMRL